MPSERVFSPEVSKLAEALYEVWGMCCLSQLGRMIKVPVWENLSDVERLAWLAVATWVNEKYINAS